jgi:hypothetical protein
MPNPNELQRLEEERNELLLMINHGQGSKERREGWLRELRAIERQLGIKGDPYNSSAFGKDYGGNGR